MAEKKRTGVITWIFLGLLAVSLGGFGVTQFGQSASTVASVGDVEISGNDYARAIQGQMRALQQQTGQPVNFQTAQAFGIDRMALGQLISEAALDHEALRIGLSASDETVANEIQQIGAFAGLSGTFDRQAYEMQLQQSGVTVSEFEETVRGDLASGLLRRAIGAGITTPDVLPDTLFNHARETRDVTWARLTASDLETPLPTPEEDALSTFHAENALDFTRPETKVIRYAWLTPDMLAPEVEVDEAQLQALYEARIDEFVQPERRLVERLVFPTEEAAREAKARLDGGEASFETLVEERGLALGDIDLGDVTEAELGAAGAEVFAAEGPEVIGPLPSDLGPALFRMNGILSAQDVSFEEARETLAPEAAADRARRMINDQISEVEDLLAGGADPALIAERTGMEEGSIEWNIDVFEGVAAYAGFRSAAQAAQPGDFGEVIELDDGGILTLTVEEVRAPELIPLDDIRDDVVAAWERVETERVLAAQAEALAERLRGGAEMAGLGLALETNRALTRDGFVEGTPPDFLTTLFSLGDDEVTVISADGDAWLIRLDAINDADHDAPDALILKGAFSAEVAQSFSNAITNAFTQGLVDEAGADINAAAVSAVNSAIGAGGL